MLRFEFGCISSQIAVPDRSNAQYPKPMFSLVQLLPLWRSTRRPSDRTTHPNLNLPQFASDAGFADQSHLTRHVKRETGFTPAQLRDLMETDEAFWSFRLMGERF